MTPSSLGSHEDRNMNTESFTAPLQASGPFRLEDEDSYHRWRDWKLSRQPASAAELLVEVADPLDLQAHERAAISERMRAANVAVYACRRTDAPPEDIVRAITGAFGLREPERHLCAEEDGITPLSVAEGGRRQRYIPYTDRPINWHTDGYYNEPRQRIRAFVLHCVRPAASGGENRLMDPEIAYIRLRDENPDFIAALMRPDAMTIPPNTQDGTEIRGARAGPVFMADPADGMLLMRYTARARHVVWRDDPVTRAAVESLVRIMKAGAPDVLRHRLGPGEGLLTNNVLHNRDGFADGPGWDQKRLIYRARFYHPLEGAGLSGARGLGTPGPFESRKGEPKP